MCGITGFVSPHVRDLEGAIQTMTNSLAHRGPDDQGTWVDSEVRIALGHRRLSILDLSPEGHQPMISADRRYVLVFNGEIYNFRALGFDLRQLGYTFKGSSDTEVLLAAIAAWGIDDAVAKLNGMFAFAVWDKLERTLHLARDRVGEKPLYCGWWKGSFIFGSELKALVAFPGFESELDHEAICQFFRYNYIPCPRSIYKGIGKLTPGSILSLDLRKSAEPRVRKYWDLHHIALAGISGGFKGTFSEAAAELSALLTDATSLRMESDVPLGAFLSGGVDSSLIVSLMQKSTSTKVKTFTIGFEEGAFDEAPHARSVAEHLGTEHTELYVTTRDALSLIPQLPQLWDEPFSDSSQIPTTLLAKLTRQHVTVALSGDGGDELFAGYQRYYAVLNSWDRITQVPAAVRRVAANQSSVLSIAEKRLEDLQAVLPAAANRVTGAALKQLRRAQNLLCRIDLSESRFYQRSISHWDEPSSVAAHGHEPALDTRVEHIWKTVTDPVHRMMLWDSLVYLPDDVLTKVDRATMANGLEARVPLLDHRIIEFAWRLPINFKADAVAPKKILRDVLYRHVPRTIIDRPKMGFGIPIDQWLKGPLRDWAQTLLSDNSMSHGFLTPSCVRREWSRFLGGRSSGHKIWDVLMFQSWYGAQAESKSP